MDFFSKCDQIRSFLRIWSHLMNSLMENFIFCTMVRLWFSWFTLVFFHSSNPLDTEPKLNVHKTFNFCPMVSGKWLLNCRLPALFSFCHVSLLSLWSLERFLIFDHVFPVFTLTLMPPLIILTILVIEIMMMKFKILLMITFYVVNPFLTCVLILYLLKARENQRFSGAFRVYKIRTFVRNKIIKKRWKVMCSARAIHNEP